MTWTAVNKTAVPTTCSEGQSDFDLQLPWFTVWGQSELYRFHSFHATAVTRVRGTVVFPGGKGSGRWAVNPDRAQTWLNERKRELQREAAPSTAGTALTDTQTLNQEVSF